MILPTDFHIFQRGRYTTNQLSIQSTNINSLCIYFLMFHTSSRNLPEKSCINRRFRPSIKIVDKSSWQAADVECLDSCVTLERPKKYSKITCGAYVAMKMRLHLTEQKFPMTGWWFSWNMTGLFFHDDWESSSQLTFIFFRGVQTTNQMNTGKEVRKYE